MSSGDVSLSSVLVINIMGYGLQGLCVYVCQFDYKERVYLWLQVVYVNRDCIGDRGKGIDVKNENGTVYFEICSDKPEVFLPLFGTVPLERRRSRRGTSATHLEVGSEEHHGDDEEEHEEDGSEDGSADGECSSAVS